MEPKPPPIHPPLPLGLGSYVTLTGISGAVAAFVIGWVQYGLTPAVATLGVTAGATVLTWFAGRSVQAKAAIEKVGNVFEEIGVGVSAPSSPTTPVSPASAPPEA